MISLGKGIGVLNLVFFLLPLSQYAMTTEGAEGNVIKQRKEMEQD